MQLPSSISMKTRTSKTKYFPKSSIWTRVETHPQSQQKSNGNQERYVSEKSIFLSNKNVPSKLSVFFFNYIFFLKLFKW